MVNIIFRKTYSPYFPLSLWEREGVREVSKSWSTSYYNYYLVHGI